MTQKNHLSHTIGTTQSIWLYFYFCSSTPFDEEQALLLILHSLAPGFAQNNVHGSAVLP